MPTPCVSLQLGTYSCVCVVDPQDRCRAPETMPDARGDVAARYESTGAPPSRSNRDRFGSSQELDTVVEQEARAEAKAKQAAHEAEDPEEVTLEAVYDTAPIHQRRSWPWPPAAAPRSMAGERRKRARDGFNVQELLFGDALAQRDFSDPSVEDVDQLSPGSSLSGWGRGDFRAQLRDLQSLLRAVEGREWEDSEVLWVLRLALRKQEGAALLRPSCLRYALLAGGPKADVE
ncbi:unnamed protein product, partial [Effrenium voratum]